MFWFLISVLYFYNKHYENTVLSLYFLFIRREERNVKHIVDNMVRSWIICMEARDSPSVCGWGRRSVHSEETSPDPESDRSWSCVRTGTYRRHDTSQSLSHISTLITRLMFSLSDTLFGLSLCNIICSMEINEEARRPATPPLCLPRNLMSGWILQHRCTVR